MKIRSQKGFGHLALLLVILVVAAAAGAGYWVYHNHNKNKTNNQAATTATTTTSAVGTPKPAAKPKPVDATAGWKTYSVPAGHYSFKYKSGWKVYSGANYTSGAAFIDAGITTVNPDSAGDMSIQSQVGDKRSNSYGLQGVTTGDRVDNTSNVTVDGVKGKRYTLTLTVSNPLPPPKNTKFIVDVFYTGGRTYSAIYIREPGAKDLSADFDNMVSTLLFNQ